MDTLSPPNEHSRIRKAIFLCYLDHHPEESDNFWQFLDNVEALATECTEMMGDISYHLFGDKVLSNAERERTMDPSQ